MNLFIYVIVLSFVRDIFDVGELYLFSYNEVINILGSTIHSPWVITSGCDPLYVYNHQETPSVPSVNALCSPPINVRSYDGTCSVALRK